MGVQELPGPPVKLLCSEGQGDCRVAPDGQLLKVEVDAADGLLGIPVAEDWVLGACVQRLPVDCGEVGLPLLRHMDLLGVHPLTFHRCTPVVTHQRTVWLTRSGRPHRIYQAPPCPAADVGCSRVLGSVAGVVSAKN